MLSCRPAHHFVLRAALGTRMPRRWAKATAGQRVAAQAGAAQPCQPRRIGRPYRRDARPDRGRSLPRIIPLFYIHGLIAAVLSSLAAGGSIFCTPGFKALRFYTDVPSPRADEH